MSSAKTFFVEIWRLPALIFRLDDGRHLFRGLLAAHGHPLFDDGVESGTEEFDVIVDVLAVEIGFRAGGVVDHHLMGFIVAELEVGLVKHLILADVGEHPQCAVRAGVGMLGIGGKLGGEVRLQLLPQLVGQVVYVQIIGVEGGTVQPGLFAQVGDGDLFQLPLLQQRDKGLLDGLNGIPAARCASWCS